MVRRVGLAIACSFKISTPLPPVPCSLSKVIDPGPAPPGAVAFFVRRLHILGKQSVLGMCLDGDPVVWLIAVVRR